LSMEFYISGYDFIVGWTKYKFFQANITFVPGKFCFNVLFHDGDKLYNIPASQIFVNQETPKLNDQVFSYYRDNDPKIYRGLLLDIKNDMFFVKYDDGDTKWVFKNKLCKALTLEACLSNPIESISIIYDYCSGGRTLKKHETKRELVKTSIEKTNLYKINSNLDAVYGCATFGLSSEMTEEYKETHQAENEKLNIVEQSYELKEGQCEVLISKGKICQVNGKFMIIPTTNCSYKTFQIDNTNLDCFVDYTGAFYIDVKQHYKVLKYGEHDVYHLMQS